MSRITVIGSGYVGLVTGVCLADRGHEVVCLDIDATKTAGLRAGVVPFHEPGLAELLGRVQATGQIRFSTEYGEAIPAAEFIFIAVNTPSGWKPLGDARTAPAGHVLPCWGSHPQDLLRRSPHS